jgi:hypothetical protein
MAKTNCPQCRRRVGPDHYACVRASAAGRAGKGASKRRGDAAYYRALAAKRRRAGA